MQTKPGMQLVLTVSPQSFMTHMDCSPYPTAVCTDYLEVKYNVSFGYTGARSADFCSKLSSLTLPMVFLPSSI